tara:strand:+ start:38 stop:454 length:417 start_codon:yes stop_codon:yes gene_type:complete
MPTSSIAVIREQTNQNMLFQPQMIPNFRMIPSAPFTTDQGFDTNRVSAFGLMILQNPIQDDGISTTETTSNAPNLNPRTYQGGNALGMIPFGMGRNQLSLTTNLDQNIPGKLLIVNNKQAFIQVKKDEKIVKIKPSTI